MSAAPWDQGPATCRECGVTLDARRLDRSWAYICPMREDEPELMCDECCATSDDACQDCIETYAHPYTNSPRTPHRVVTARTPGEGVNPSATPSPNPGFAA